MMLVPVHVVVMNVPGTDAAEHAVPHEFDRIAPDTVQPVAVLGIDPPETSAPDLVVTAREENHFLSPDDPVVPPVHDGDAELAYPDMAAVPEFLPIPDAGDIGPSAISLMILETEVVVPVAAVLMMAGMMSVVLMPVILMCGIPVMVTVLLPRCTENGEEQC